MVGLFFHESSTVKKASCPRHFPLVLDFEKWRFALSSGMYPENEVEIIADNYWLVRQGCVAGQNL